MSKFEKLLFKIYNLQDITFEEGKKVLLSYGFIERSPKSGSSHVTFTKEDKKAVTLVKTQKPLKPYAIRLIKEAIKND